MQCCMISCVATCSGLLQNGAFVSLRTVSAYLFLTDDPMLRSLYLDSDPKSNTADPRYKLPTDPCEKI